MRRLVRGRDAFALAHPDGGPLLETHARRWGAIEEITVFDDARDEWLECYRVLQGAEIWEQLGPWISATRPTFGPSIAPRFADAAAIQPPAVKHYRALRQTIADRLRALIPAGTGLVIPTTPGPAPAKSAPSDEISSFYRLALPLNAIAGHAGLPQVTIPVAQIQGCPLGLSIVGARGSDHALLGFAAKVADPFADRRQHV